MVIIHNRGRGDVSAEWLGSHILCRCVPGSWTKSLLIMLSTKLPRRPPLCQCTFLISQIALLELNYHKVSISVCLSKSTLMPNTLNIKVFKANSLYRKTNPLNFYKTLPINQHFLPSFIHKPTRPHVEPSGLISEKYDWQNDKNIYHLIDHG